ncbi:MAG TPA: hypothetical protein PLD25_20945 [Chloroflexota bacterium]|nr:hypothetical protein [Chloroflexota bacterium]HUM71793.1 hypothetical protein [Chloroflexota bacterium]
MVFNAHYLTYFDTAVTEYLRWRDYNVWQQAATGFDFHTVKRWWNIGRRSSLMMSSSPQA